jgi:hypothetical protein
MMPLFQAIHPFTNLHVHPSIWSSDVSKFLVVDGSIRDERQWEVHHVLVMCHWHVQVEILDVIDKEAHTWDGNGAVDKALCGGEFCGGSAYDAGILEPVSLPIVRRVHWLSTFGVEFVHNDASIGYFAIIGNSTLGNEECSVNSGWHLGAHTLG